MPAGTTAFANESHSDVGTVPLFFQMFKIIYFIILSHYLHGKLHLTLFCYLHHRCVHGRVKPALVS